jgi:exodeoxyribonuclease-5
MSIAVKDLSLDQLEAYNAITRWISGSHDEPSVLSLGGFAGTGKSTLVSLVAEQVELPAFCAYTGKATSVLRRKLAATGTETVGTQKKNRDGVMSHEGRPYCGTIHSLIYRPCDCLTPQTVEIQKPCPEKDCIGETRWEHWQPFGKNASVCAKGHIDLIKSEKAFEALKPKKKFVYVEKIDGRCKLCGGKEWLRRETLDRNYGLIIVDEASMVDDMMLRDLRSYNVPILAVGDHGQLPPVGGSGTLMKNPNLRLEQIHRQAEGNPIIALSKIIRETGRIPDDMPESEAVRFGKLRFVEQIIEQRYEGATPARLLEMGIACYTNRRRVGLNVAVRRALGTARNGRELARKGEHVICLRNMKAEGGRPPVANGMRGVLQSDVEFKQNVNYRGEKLGLSETQVTGVIAFPEDEIEANSYTMLAQQFGREKPFSSPEELAKEVGIHSFAMAGALFDYGFAMTTHKLQGSSIEDLVVCAERPGPVDAESWKRWCYSSITRASHKILILK